MEGEVKIQCNWRWRDPIYGYELTAKERAEFDYISDEDIEVHEFARYRGNVYDLSDFMRVSETDPSHPQRGWLAGWHGYIGDSFFSGILLKWDADCERVMLATWMC